MPTNIKKTNRNAATPKITIPVAPISEKKGWRFINVLLIHLFNEVLGPHDACNSHRFARRNRAATFCSSWSRVARSTLNIGDFPDPVGGDRGHNRSRLPNECPDPRFTGALCLLEHEIE